MFLEYLEEAYTNATEMRNVQFKSYIRNLVTLLLDNDFTHEEVLAELPSEVSDYFNNEFTRCDWCKEWTRDIDLEQARYDLSKQVCPSCREDGC